MRVDAEQSITRKSELRSFIWHAEADAVLTARKAWMAYGLCTYTTHTTWYHTLRVLAEGSLWEGQAHR
eukprot:3074024-Prymnesium_polylepis.1